MSGSFKISDEDVLGAMKEIEGYLDISVQDFRELYVIALKHARKRFLRSTPIETIMQTDVVTVGLSAQLEEIITALAENGISGVPVIDDNQKVAGVVSEKDIFAKLGGRADASFWEILSGCIHSNRCLIKSIISATVADIMTSPAITAAKSDSVQHAVELCRRKNINRLPVVDGDRILVGIVTRSDILDLHVDETDH